MNQAAAAVMADWGDAVLAFGESDEYSFVLPRSCSTYSRRSSKISTTIASSFAANFVFHLPRFFPDTPLRAPPAFDARCVCYPTLRAVSDCIRWRQVDTHINSLHNEIFWALVLLGALPPWCNVCLRQEPNVYLPTGGMPNDDASKLLAGTVSEQKHELLFSRFGINYAKASLSLHQPRLRPPSTASSRLHTAAPSTVQARYHAAALQLPSVGGGRARGHARGVAAPNSRC